MDLDHFHLSFSNLALCPHSLIKQDGAEYALAQTSTGLQLVILADPVTLTAFEGKVSEFKGKSLFVGPKNSYNANALRNQLHWLRPCLLGLRTSAGMGDRIGLATPGHVRATRAAQGKIAPMFAQQSIREMKRTERTPQQVLDDAAWGVFAESWQDGFGADADHLKTPEDIDACLAAGYTFFTIDPGAFVDNRTETASLSELRELATKLPTNIKPQSSGLLGKSFNIEGLMLSFTEAVLLKATIKYGRAVAHVATMYHHLAKVAQNRPFELEVSVDETDQPTTHAEHIYIASELKRLGVKWVSLAPRYVGRFEKGVDYIGDVHAFEKDIAGHAAIAHQLGPYKLSLHSGSDKFSIYPAAMRQTRGMVHLKTAGTSYLEALRTVAVIDADFFREIYLFTRERFDTDKASYHISAELSRAPLPQDVTDWPGLLEQFDAREILHVTFGSVLTTRTGDGHFLFYDRLMAFLNVNAEAYAINLEKHFKRHLTPFLSTE